MRPGSGWGGKALSHVEPASPLISMTSQLHAAMEKAELDREMRMLQQKLADESNARARAVEDKERAEAESLSRLDAVKSEKERSEAAMQLARGVAASFASAEKGRLEREALATSL